MLSLIQRLETKGSFVQNVASTFLVQGFSLFLSIAAAAIVARWLGPEGKGILAMALLLPGMMRLFLSGGIEVANVYFAGSRRLDLPTLTANSATFAVLATVLAIGVAGILAATGWLGTLVPGVPLQLVLLAMVGIPLGLFTGYLSSILVGLQRITTANVTTLSQGVTRLILTIALVIGCRWGLVGALLASLGAMTVNTLAVAALLRREGGVFLPRWNLPVMRTTLSFGLRGYVGNVLQFFNYRLDMFLVNYFLGPTGVGIYTVSVSMAELLWYLPNAVGFVIFPRAAATKPEVMNAFTPRVFRITLGLTALGALGLALLGKPLTILIYSSAFANAFIPMLVLLPGVVLLGSAKVLTNEIAGRGYPHYNSAASGLALVLTLVLDLLLIPRLGVLGASLASSVAYTAIFFISIVFYLIVSRKTTAVTLPPLPDAKEN